MMIFQIIVLNVTAEADFCGIIGTPAGLGAGVILSAVIF